MVLRARIGSRRVQVHRILHEQGARTLGDPMDALRAVLARFGSSDDLVDDAITMVAAAPVANSWW